MWQTLILSRWRPVLAYLPVESVICAQQEAYYAALAASDQAGEATPFVEFMLRALMQALVEVAMADQVTGQVARLLDVLKPGVSLKANELMQALKLTHRATFRGNYLKPALAAGLIEMTDPASPRSPAQQYRRVTN